MKKLLLLFIGMSLLSCSSDDSSTVQPPTEQQYIPDNILYFYADENALHGNYKMQFNGAEIDGYLTTSTTGFYKIINADLITHLDIQAHNDSPLSMKFNRSNINVEGGIYAGKHYLITFTTDQDGYKILDQINEL
ncbi:hypothetical protein E0W68_02185 [Flavobacterium salilacus subsp. salilacus]|uniref:hypothetical protein n=1 Tax=Flavobacterium TaxID=237 RepID=UPI00107515B9|nr:MULTISPECIES: hypothetical protein [Flavobacterium]KAF2520051.1 hypothetical protein E0W68_02185 [Flavobacterium salilacus subsp. salilacus]MBE1614033.1 hypothetical protein [Flavobacterium sp. SaA2.13]